MFSHHRPFLRRIDVRTAAFVLLVGAIACSSPTHPSVSVASGRPVSPTTGTQFSYYSQPITLIVVNGVATGGASPTTAVEVATDAAFTAIVTTQTVTSDANGQPTVTLDHLTPATTYYWRVKTAMLTYRFEVATDAAFSPLVATGTVPEGPGQTSFNPSADLVSGASYVWRVLASDTAKGVTSGFSTAQPFTTANPDDGTFPYVFHVHAPSTCREGDNYLRFGPDYDTGGLLYPANLVVSADTLRFSIKFETLNIDMARIGTSLSGTIGGSVPTGYGPFYLQIAATQAGGRAGLSGNVDGNGRLAGTFGGVITEASCCEYHYCTASNFMWTLTPGR